MCWDGRFIDWMALAGHNSIVAPTGQEEAQYRVLTSKFGLSDMAVRNWTNGPGIRDILGFEVFFIIIMGWNRCVFYHTKEN
jgi:hypothetical protein